MLDEPANGLDPVGTRHVHRVLTGLAAQGTAVVLSSHRMDDLAALCSEVTLLAGGRVVFSGPPSELAADTDELDYRLRTSDPAAARRVAAGAPALHLLPDDDLLQRDAGALRVRAAVPAWTTWSRAWSARVWRCASWRRSWRRSRRPSWP